MWAHVRTSEHTRVRTQLRLCACVRARACVRVCVSIRMCVRLSHSRSLLRDEASFAALLSVLSSAYSHKYRSHSDVYTKTIAVFPT